MVVGARYSQSICRAAYRRLTLRDNIKIEVISRIMQQLVRRLTMNKMLVIVNVCFVFGFISSVFASEPLHDRLIIGESEGIIFPEKCCWLDLPKSKKLRELKFKQRCSAIGGPVGIFTLADGKLWLTGLRVCGGEISLNEVYPDRSSNTFANWLNGKFYAYMDFLCRISKSKKIYKTELELNVEKGVVISKRVISNDESACK